MSFVPVAVNQSRSLAYRAVEVEQIQKRNMLIALAISIAIHSLILTSYYLFPVMAIDMGRDPSDKIITWIAPPSTQPPNYVPEGSLGAPRLSDVHAGVVVPIPDVVADPNQTLVTQKQLGNRIVAGDPLGGDGSGGLDNAGSNEATPTIIDEEEPPPFVSVEQMPVLVRRVTPKYPELMLKAGIQGKVYVNICVNKEGKPHQVRILKGDNELFNEAAIEAAKQFLFTPAYMNNGAVSVWVSVPFSFELK